jgi:diketogulonate reductase-like aldo/keto reductase
MAMTETSREDAVSDDSAPVASARHSRRAMLRLAPAALFLPTLLLASNSGRSHAATSTAPNTAGTSAGTSADRAFRRNTPPGFETLPPIGMGTWLTFDIGNDAVAQAQRREVLDRFFAAGGGMIDSSPMYGSAEWLVGQLLREMGDSAHRTKLVSATKVWTALEVWGPKQLEQSLKLWGLPAFDVVLVHNLLNWRAHLKLLRRWKDEGRVRKIGISTSHAVANDEAARIIRAEKLDVLQITYNFADTSAEKTMELAASRAMAVVINRPFDGGALFDRVRNRRLPGWASEVDCANWAQFFLKWVVSHPAVTCAIPATRVPVHMDENMGARSGAMPDAAMRRKMQGYFNA